MRVLSKIIPVFLCPLLALILLGAIHAQTPTPTAMPTTVTPVPPEPAAFAVIPWVNGRNSAREVIARIGETTCATGVPSTGAGARPHFNLSVPSEEVVPGCGYEGAVVTFFVDGQQAPQTAVWHPRAFKGAFVSVTVIIGPPFALIFGGFGPSTLSPGQVIVPYVGNAPCGHAEPGSPSYMYEAVVYSAEQQAGCGVEGSQVTFKLLDAQGNVIAVANEKGTWHAWDGVSEPQLLDLTFGPPGFITMPGTGAGPQRSTAPWGHLALGLASLGLAGGIAALALRRRAMPR